MSRTSSALQAPTGAGSGLSASAIRLEVRGTDGRTRVLELVAPNEAEAMRSAAARGFTVLAVGPASNTAGSSFTRDSAFPLLHFSQELLALLEAGLNLTEALDTLLAKERRAAVHAVLQRIVQELSQGRNLSDVLARAPRHFPEVYVATIRASERTGDLAPALARYITYQMQFDVMQKKLVTALIYPVMLLAVGGFVTLFLLGYVVPRLSSVYESAGREMPWLSSLLLAAGAAINRNWPVVLAATCGTLAVAAFALGRADGRRAFVEHLLRLPWLATKNAEFRLARFYRAVALLLAAGIALPRAMGMVTGLLANAQRVRLERARSMVEHGQCLSAALLSQGLAGAVADSLIKVGERSGQLAQMLERTARFHDDDLGRWIDWASRLLEPILMLLIGIVIGGVVVLMYMPIFELAGSLQ